MDGPYKLSQDGMISEFFGLQRFFDIPYLLFRYLVRNKFMLCMRRIFQNQQKFTGNTERFAG